MSDVSASASTAPVSGMPSRKRQRVDDNAEDATSTGTSGGIPNAPDAGIVPPFEGIPAALKVIRAIDEVQKLPALGDCPTKRAAEDKRMRWYTSDPPDNEDENDTELSAEELGRIQRNEALITQLSTMQTPNHASGCLAAPFSLRVTRARCEFDGLIAPSVPKSEDDVDEVVKSRLRRWFDNAAVSGYGDVREQVTKIDEEVRAAREISSSEFEVEPELLRRIEGIWCEHFVPSSDVRAQPYKIHLYGEDGHFKSHRDTPEHGLVGTFLLGLGDTTRRGGLVVENKKMSAHPGEWCAFYPDIPHKVDYIEGGHRAVIAFKILRTPSSMGETEKTRQVRAQVLEIVKKLEAPYGILLQHKYGVGTEQFSGFDAIVAECVRSAVPAGYVYQLPVVVRSFSWWGTKSMDGYGDWHQSCSTTVYPFAREHIDALVSGEAHSYEEDHARFGHPWLNRVKNVPFFSIDLSRTMATVYSEEQETCNYVGNEAQAWDAKSVYLSYALIVAAPTGAAEKASGNDSA
ncbi:hypothetical protein ONZ51_g2454 [Trametes cubensis]|uniref:Prolyl 4-hydroxylase alpha subunit Fe(2+) 2OG dioxygenase domain-containing protein n=1 Tax=Trametes cubensis TaxID=1111947 RepID=A0AAD7U282_9APHY|nr:hypothetical protein ONZ51_g2454 [Trametes cubensis]